MVAIKRYIFSLQITGLGDTEDEAKRDAVEQLSTAMRDYKEIISWFTLIKSEFVEE